jgi:hypothetical protein
MKAITRTLLGAGVAAALFTAVVGAQSSAIPRTPWGDPDIQGTYTNSNESGIPMERPAEFAGRRVEDVKPEELARLIQQRAARQEKVAETIGGSTENDTGAGPPHWYENYQAKNSRAWMLSEPEDGKIPATTDDAKRRAAAVRALRAVYHPRRARLDDAGYLRQLVRDHPGPGRGRHPLRDGA